MGRYKDNIEENREYYRKYYEKNKEKLREYSKLWSRKKYGAKQRILKDHSSEKNRLNSRESKRRSTKESYLRTTYNIGLKEYNEMFSKQEGKCAICGVHQTDLARPLYVDHCHVTGTIRGLLCNRCNLGLGHFREDTILIEEAKKYLEKYDKLIIYK